MSLNRLREQQRLKSPAEELAIARERLEQASLQTGDAMAALEVEEFTRQIANLQDTIVLETHKGAAAGSRSG